MRVAACQLKTSSIKEESLKKAGEMISQAARSGAQLVVLPEMFQCPYDVSKFREYGEENPGSMTMAFLSKKAAEENVYLIGGSIPEISDGKIFNTSFCFDSKGNLIGRHRKVHLFDIDVPGGIRFMESDVLTAGDSVTVIDTEFGKIGVAICFDMRFPELMRSMAQKGAQLIVVPAAFNMVTGPAHWEMTARMRALDNQVFFMAVSGARDMDFTYHAYGNSILTNPWGEVIARLDEKEGILISDIDFSEIGRFRQELPIVKSLKPDVYYQ